MDGETDSESGDSVSEKNQTKGKGRSKYASSFTYKTRFRKEWTTEWPFIRPAPEKENFFTCTVCRKEVSCGHQGKGDVICHISSTTHVKLLLHLVNSQS